MVCIYTTEYYSVTKRKKQCHLQQHEWTQRLAHSAKYYKSEKERQIPRDIIRKWNLKYNTNVFIHKKEIDTQNRFLGAKGERGWGGTDWEFGIRRRKPIYIGWTDNKVLLPNTGSCIQYPTANHNAKEYIHITEPLTGEQTHTTR